MPNAYSSSFQETSPAQTLVSNNLVDSTSSIETLYQVAHSSDSSEDFQLRGNSHCILDQKYLESNPQQKDYTFLQKESVFKVYFQYKLIQFTHFQTNLKLSEIKYITID